jgi:hypothetical protein
VNVAAYTTEEGLAIRPTVSLPPVIGSRSQQVRPYRKQPRPRSWQTWLWLGAAAVTMAGATYVAWHGGEA